MPGSSIRKFHLHYHLFVCRVYKGFFFPFHLYMRRLLELCSVWCSVKVNSWHLIPTSWCLFYVCSEKVKTSELHKCPRSAVQASLDRPKSESRLTETFPFCHPGIPSDGSQQHQLIPNNVAGVVRASSTWGLDLKPRQRLEQGNTQSSLLPFNIVYALAQIPLGSFGSLF